MAKDGLTLIDLEYLLTMGFSTLFMALTNKATAKKFKRAFLKLGRAIDAQFPGEICK